MKDFGNHISAAFFKITPSPLDLLETLPQALSLNPMIATSVI
jgi:hypothetical protein